uniref:40S ribosomal protein S27 n=1 Tax=Setaria italica TaxID=4555 RepID=K3YDP6_SETIT
PILPAATCARLRPPAPSLRFLRRKSARGGDRISKMVLQNDIDLLNPPAELEKLKHKKKRLVQSPNSFFMDVKCQGCFSITTVFSHSQTVVVCPGCQTVLCQPTGGKARLTEGCSFRRKGD